jgi:hypothetical protein
MLPSMRLASIRAPPKLGSASEVGSAQIAISVAGSAQIAISVVGSAQIAISVAESAQIAISTASTSQRPLRATQAPSRAPRARSPPRRVARRRCRCLWIDRRTASASESEIEIAIGRCPLSSTMAPGRAPW